jgi:hypothetical protein
VGGRGWGGFHEAFFPSSLDGYTICTVKAHLAYWLRLWDLSETSSPQAHKFMGKEPYEMSNSKELRTVCNTFLADSHTKRHPKGITPVFLC